MVRLVAVGVAAALLLTCGAPSPGDGGTGGGGGSGGSGGTGGAGGTGGGGSGGTGGTGGGGSGGTGGTGGAGGAGGGGACAPFDAGLGSTTELEPNNGAAAGEVNSVGVPGGVSGAIGAANDLDIFTATLTAGQTWRWTLDGACGALAPHLSVVEQANSVPLLVARGPAQGRVVLEQLVLKTSTYNFIVRDSRNVPSSTSQNQGSAQHTYVLAGAASARVATAVAVPSTTPAALPNRHDSALFSFTLGNSTAVTLRARAQAKAPPSDLDTRLTLFSATTNSWLGTNDDASGSTTDSTLTGTLPAGDYRVLVDNLNESASNLSFELQLTSP